MTTLRFISAAKALLGSSSVSLAALLIGASAIHAEAMAAPAGPAGGKIKAAATYHNYCSVCHGDKGDGRSRAQGSMSPAPKDFTSAATSMQLTRDGMIDAVSNGRPGTAMTGWKTQLNEKEIKEVVDYIRTTFMPPPASKDGNRGRVVYSRNCAVCHGDKGDGRSRAQGSLNPPPLDFTSTAARTALSRERMIQSITYGRPETAMAGFKRQLNGEDIEAVADFILTGFMSNAGNQGISGTSSGARHVRQPHGMTGATMPTQPIPAPARKTVAPDMKAAMPQGLKGDAVKGAAFYMSNCATCHGATGDGRGPRAYFINPKPRNFLHTASRHELNRVAIFNATSEGKYGTEMPAWNKVLGPKEIADVAEFVFQRFIQPPAGTKQAKAVK